MSMLRRERRANGLLAWQLVLRTIRLHREGADVVNMDQRELAVAIAADMREDGLCKAIDWERVIELILEYLPQIIQLILTLR